MIQDKSIVIHWWKNRAGGGSKIHPKWSAIDKILLTVDPRCIQSGLLAAKLCWRWIQICLLATKFWWRWIQDASKVVCCGKFLLAADSRWIHSGSKGGSKVVCWRQKSVGDGSRVDPMDPHWFSVIITQIVLKTRAAVKAAIWWTKRRFRYICRRINVIYNMSND